MFAALSVPACVKSVFDFTPEFTIENVSKEDIRSLELNHGYFSVMNKVEEVTGQGSSLDAIIANGNLQPAFTQNVLMHDAPVEVVGETRVELHVNNPDGSRTLLASVDSRDGGHVVVEKSLEDKIREAVEAGGGTVTENPMANALANAKKNHH